MKRLFKWIVVISVLAALITLGGGALGSFFANRNRVQFRTAEAKRGDITLFVNSTGTIEPVLKVEVGAAVSGPVEETLVDFNSRVSRGDVMARIDQRNFLANVARDEASLAYKKAEFARITALLEQAENNEKRAQDLRNTKKHFISDAEIDQFTAQRKSLSAQLDLAQAGIQESEAMLGVSRTNLEYTVITAPVDGIVIDRKIDPGQTVAASFQTPVMFIVAPDMEKEMNVYASVDEADIGLIREAQTNLQPVQFTVDAYPDLLFQGRVDQVRLNPTTTQNVVTYTVVVKTENSELKLLPGMTANLSFQIKEHRDVLRIPNAALRFYPAAELVRDSDKPLLEGRSPEEPKNEPEAAPELTAGELSESARNRNRRHVWVEDPDGKLRAIAVTTGLSDNLFTELVTGDLSDGTSLVTGIKQPGTP